MAQDPNTGLGMLALFIETDVKTVVQAGIVTLNADLRFAQCDRKEEVFAMNPANAVAYQAMRALEHQAIVRVAEALGKDAQLLPEGTTLRRNADLVWHRDAISHAYTADDAWRRKPMREFAASDRQWLDRKAALVWDMWRSLNELLFERGLPSRGMTVGLGAQHAGLVHSIMRASVKPDVVLPSEDEIIEHLQKFRDDYIKLLERAPDGRNAEAEARSLARKEASRQRWNKPR